MKSLKVIVFSLAFFLFLSVNTSAQISIDGNFTDWADVPALATDAAGDGNGSCDFTALYVTDDANYVYIRVSLAPGSDVSAAGKTINLFVSVDPDNEPAAISGLSYGWWSNGYDFFSQIYPDNWDFFKHVGANTWWSWAATGTPGIMAWNAGHNDVEVRLPKAELNNPDIAGFSSQGKIAVYVQASDYSDEITSSGAHGGFIYTFKPVQTNGVINITMIDRRGPVHRHRGDRILRRALDHAVGIGQVDQRVAARVDHAHDAQLLEHQADALVEDLLLLRQRLGEADLRCLRRTPTW